MQGTSPAREGGIAKSMDCMGKPIAGHAALAFAPMRASPGPESSVFGGSIGIRVKGPSV